jgi:hypothetical protein
MAAVPDPKPIVALARRYPVPFAVGAVGFVVGVRLLARRAPAPATTPAATPAGKPAPAPRAAAPAPTPLPVTPRILTTPEGCPLPKPPASAGVGPGDFVCDRASRTWVWQPDAPQLSADGCPLPKPAIPATHAGLGDWTCVARRWEWTWKDAPTAPPIAGVLVLKAGTYQTWGLSGTSLVDPRWVTLGVVETWRTGPRVTRNAPGSQLPGGGTLPGHSGLFVPIVSAPGRAGLHGRMFETTQTGAAWRAS